MYDNEKGGKLHFSFRFDYPDIGKYFSLKMIFYKNIKPDFLLHVFPLNP